MRGVYWLGRPVRAEEKLTSSETLYAAFVPKRGDKKGKWALYQWSLPEGDARHVPDHISNMCMAEKCGRHFGLLGRSDRSREESPAYS